MSLTYNQTIKALRQARQDQQENKKEERIQHKTKRLVKNNHLFTK